MTAHWPEAPPPIDWSKIELAVRYLGLETLPDPAAPLRAVAAAALEGADAAAERRQSPQTAADDRPSEPARRRQVPAREPNGPRMDSSYPDAANGPHTGTQSLDPREIGPQWEDRLTDAIHPAGGRTWTYTERTELVLTAVRELLWERITPLLAATCPGHEDCPRCDITDPCPCCGLRFVDGRWVMPAGCGPECAEHHTYGPGCGAQIHNGQTDNEPVVDEDPAPPAGTLRDQIAEAIHATSVCEIGDPARCGGSCRDAAAAVLPIIEQEKRSVADGLGKQLARVGALEMDLKRERAQAERLSRRTAEAEAQAELTRGELVNTRRTARAAEAALDRTRTLHADTVRQLRADLTAEVQKREAADARLTSVRGLAADLRGITGARHIANALDKILTPKEN